MVNGRLKGAQTHRSRSSAPPGNMPAPTSDRRIEEADPRVDRRDFVDRELGQLCSHPCASHVVVKMIGVILK